MYTSALKMLHVLQYMYYYYCIIIVLQCMYYSPDSMEQFTREYS